MLFITKRASNLIAVPTKRFCLNITTFVIPPFSIVTKTEYIMAILGRCFQIKNRLSQINYLGNSQNWFIKS